jgi:methyl-accepting chemotaxis protein
MTLNLTVGKKIGLGFVAVTLVLVLTCAKAILSYNDNSAKFEEYQRQSLNNELIGSVNETILMERIAAVYYLWHFTDESFAKYENASRQSDELLQRAGERVKDPERAQKVKELVDLMADYDKGFQVLNSYVKSKGEAADAQEKAALISKVTTQGPLMAAAIHAITDSYAKALKQRGEDLIQANRRAVLVMEVSSGLALLLSLLCAYLIPRGITKAVTQIVKSLHGAVTQVLAASQEVAKGGQSLAQGASEQAASLEETAATLEQLSSSSKHNADGAETASTIVQEAKRGAEASSTSMSSMAEAVESIRRATQETENIIKTIDEIAFQTNLLALNAAVEAARAGDAGKGFAVVAEEVRSLAQRSSSAAKDTAEKIKRSRELADTGVAASQQVAKSLEAILEHATKASSVVAEIATSSGEQSTSVNQINLAVAELDKVVQGNASQAEQFAASGEELSSQANLLTDTVTLLSKLVYSRGFESEHTDRYAHARRGPERHTQSEPARKVSAGGRNSYELKTRSSYPEVGAVSKPKPPQNREITLKPSDVIPLEDNDLLDV